MTNPAPINYLSTYPDAVKLWLAGKPKEAASAFVKSQVQLVLPGSELKARAYAQDCQNSENSRISARVHEKQTDAVCKRLWEMVRQWPVGGPLIENSALYKAMVSEFNARRAEWQTLYGVYREQEKARIDAIRLKKFVRLMRLLAKQT
jgi:hypothetical protein